MAKENTDLIIMDPENINFYDRLTVLKRCFDEELISKEEYDELRKLELDRWKRSELRLYQILLRDHYLV
jgi:hypothetical protein